MARSTRGIKRITPSLGDGHGKEQILSDWLHGLPAGWMAVVFFGCAYLSAALIYAVVMECPTSMWVRARTFSASMLSPMGTLFALFVAFTAAQVWNMIVASTVSPTLPIHHHPLPIDVREFQVC